MPRQFIRIVNRLVNLEKAGVLELETGVKLYPSEIHMLLALDDPGIEGFAGLVEYLSVTKGAVSQTLSRLVKKGLIEKHRRDIGDLSIRFSADGRKALVQCKSFKAGLIGRLNPYFSGLSAEDEAVIKDFLDKVEENLANRP